MGSGTARRVRVVARGVQVMALSLACSGAAGVEAVRRRATAGGRTTGRSLAERVTGLLGVLGPSFVKGGQILSTRQDLLPEHWRAELRRLYDDVPPPSRRSIGHALRRAYGERESWPFTEFDPRPTACGSIASVHRAVLADGRVVAVKVRRMDIERTMGLDSELLRGLARALRRVPALKRVPLDDLVGQVADAMVRQLDFTAEHQALKTLRRNLGGLPFVRVPEPVDDLCADGVLVMEYLPGLAPFRPDSLSPDRRREIATRTLQVVYRMLFTDGVVHCDLHPGNLYLDRDLDVVILDAGFVVELPDRVRRLFSAFFANMVLGRGRRCADIVIESASSWTGDGSLDGFRREMAELVERETGARSGDFELAVFATRLFDLQRRHGLYAAPEFVFPLLSLLVVEGMIKSLASDVDFQAEALPILLASRAAG
ncbi:hypothetical protein ADK67_25775 [Saccharothrix sp. NRRL B-16348]|nr:hypothetical protein ADK67_25775 [Saccharothrix sp. NRRL B-16348]